MGALIRPARRVRANFALACAVLGLLTAAAAAAPSAQALGTKDFAFNIGGSPTGSKPESKLFFAHGSWFGVLWSNTAAAYRIHRLENDAWVDTGVAVDTSGSSRADTLYQSSNDTLYVSTHPFTDSGHGASQKPSSTGAEVGKYAWDAINRRFVLATIAKHINAFKSETFVMERDSTGTLWATFTTGNKIWATHSSAGDSDAGWIPPYVVPGAADLDSDDTASIIHFGGDKIGVAWSNQKTGQLLFSVHADGAGDGAWATEVVPTGWTPDDHINLKAASDGRVFMATKTSEDLTNHALTLLEVRGAGGGWSGTVFGRVQDSNTRAIVLLDEQNQTVHMYATCPAPGQSSGQSGGDICEKTTSMAAPSFGVGNGPAFISDSTVSASAANMNDATSTKQNVNGATGILIAGNDTKTYFHRLLGLPGGAPPLGAAFTAASAGGLAVRFTDTSSGSPTSWVWSFGDGGASGARSPVHAYPAPGTYRVGLTVSNSSTTASTTANVTVTANGQVSLTPIGAPSGGALGTTAKTCSANRRVRVGLPKVKKGSPRTARYYVSGKRVRLIKAKKGKIAKSVLVTLNRRTGSRVLVRVRYDLRYRGKTRIVIRDHRYAPCV